MILLPLFCHDHIQFLTECRSISKCVMPHLTPNHRWESLNPEFPHSFSALECIPIGKDLLLPNRFHVMHPLLFLLLQVTLLLLGTLTFFHLLYILFSIFFNKFLMLSLLFHSLWRQILRSKCHRFNSLGHITRITCCYCYILKQILKLFRK